MFNSYLSWILDTLVSISWVPWKFTFYNGASLGGLLVALIICGIIFRSLIMRS